MKCTNCGAVIDKDSVYCEFCGTKIETDSFSSTSESKKISVIRKVKTQAKNDLSGNWGNILTVSLVFWLLYIAYFLIDRWICPSPNTYDSIGSHVTSYFASGLLSLAFSVIPIYYCFTLIFLNFIRGARQHLLKLSFSHMRNYKRAVGVTFMINLYTFLWSLLLFVPGIIKFFAYSMTYYISLDHPEYTIDECIETSRKMMYGHKWELFVLYLSFAGWILIGIVTLGIGFIWILPYMETTVAHYYEYLNDLYSQRKPSYHLLNPHK